MALAKVGQVIGGGAGTGTQASRDPLRFHGWVSGTAAYPVPTAGVTPAACGVWWPGDRAVSASCPLSSAC